MALDMISVRGGTVTDTAMALPANLTEKKWLEIGERLGRAERAVGWWIGDWWNAGERYGKRVELVNAEGWKGPSIKTCRTYGVVAARFDPSSRRDTLPFSHYQEVAALPVEQARAMLQHADEVRAQQGAAPPTRMMRQLVKQQRRETRETAMAGDIARASTELGEKLYGVIYADPPWRFEPYSRTTGMDRSADNHYPTMTLDQLSAMKVPAAPDCALFMWATAPMLIDAIDLIAAWDFDYRTHWVWVKNRPGTGYWNRSCHELLLLGVRGDIPAPAPGRQLDSVFSAVANGHSAKPAAAAEMIEEMFPSQALLEMFARGPRLGWTVWGAESREGERIASDSGVGLFEDTPDPRGAERVA